MQANADALRASQKHGIRDFAAAYHRYQMIDELPDFEAHFRTLTRRYRGITPEALIAVMCPLLIPIRTLDKNIIKLPDQNHYRATFTVALDDENRSVVQRGCTGKFVPLAYKDGGAWNEIAKGRFIQIDYGTGIAEGEIYTGASKSTLEDALNALTPDDLLEIDQYGAAAKVLSGLAEYYLVEMSKLSGYEIYRMPEDMARHLGAYRNFDFLFQKGEYIRRVEVKSLWGTNTRYARLIHSTNKRPKGDPPTWTDAQKQNYYPTSSCKFATQDIFAVSLFLRTGNIKDFAFARSVPEDLKAYGLPRSSGYPDHVNQNPVCEIENGVWFSSIDEVWDLD